MKVHGLTRSSEDGGHLRIPSHLPERKLYSLRSQVETNAIVELLGDLVEPPQHSPRQEGRRGRWRDGTKWATHGQPALRAARGLTISSADWTRRRVGERGPMTQLERGRPSSRSPRPLRTISLVKGENDHSRESRKNRCIATSLV